MENGIDDPSVSMETKPRGFLRREEDLAVQASDVDNDNKRTRIQTILLLEDDLPAMLIEEAKTLKNAFLLRSRINFVVSSWTSLGRSRFEFTFLLLLPEAKKKSMFEPEPINCTCRSTNENPPNGSCYESTGILHRQSRYESRLVHTPEYTNTRRKETTYLDYR